MEHMALLLGGALLVYLRSIGQIGYASFPYLLGILRVLSNLAASNEIKCLHAPQGDELDMLLLVNLLTLMNICLPDFELTLFLLLSF